MSFRYWIAVLLLPIIAACSKTALKPDADSAAEGPVVWADDGSEVALAVTMELPPLSDTGGPRYRHRILLQKTDGSDRRTATPPRPYRCRGIYYMKRAGYLIVESQLNNGHVRIDRISPAGGTEIPVIETRGALNPCADSRVQAYIRTQVIPSPDGKLLAHAYSQACGEITVDFLDAGRLIALSSETLPIDGPARLTWHPQGHLLVALDDGRTAWLMMPGQVTLPATYPACLTPATTSSDVASNGRRAVVEGEKIRTKAGGRAFGCQSGGPL